MKLERFRLIAFVYGMCFTNELALPYSNCKNVKQSHLLFKVFWKQLLAQEIVQEIIDYRL